MVQKGRLLVLVAAQSIGEPGTQLTLRTFHVVVLLQKGASESRHEAKFGGVIELEEMRTLPYKEGDKKYEVVVGRSGEFRIVDPTTKAVFSNNNIPYGSHLFDKNGDTLKKGDVICRMGSIQRSNHLRG